MSIQNFYEKIPKEFLNDPYHNPNKCKGVPIHPFRMIIAGAAGSGKTNASVNLITECNAFERIYIYAKQLDQPLYEFLITNLEKVQSKLKKQIITYSSEITDIPSPDKFDKTKQNLIIIDDMIMEKNLKSVEELYVRSRNRNCSVIFLSQSHYPIPKMIRMNTGYLILRGIDNKRDFKMIATNFSLDKSPEELFKMYNKAISVPMQWFMVDLITTDPKMRYRAGFKVITDDEQNGGQVGGQLNRLFNLKKILN